MTQNLTKRQISILKLCCLGKCSKEIAALLFIEVKTVDKHKSNILKKFNAANMVQVAYQYGNSSR
jgi:DNA-binding NarL/FixJ family response regulator